MLKEKPSKRKAPRKKAGNNNLCNTLTSEAAISGNRKAAFLFYSFTPSIAIIIMSSLIVGLGNMGADYEHTRHNVGFDILDVLAGQFQEDSTFETSRHGDIFKFRTKGRSTTLLKPSTFVNLSGKAVAYWMQKEKVKLENVLIVTDDIALPFGTLRLRATGNNGGHNGLKHIDQVLGTNNYARLRVGIGGEFDHGQQVNFVLGHWTEEERSSLDERIEMASRMILSFCTAGVDRTMSQYNNK